MRSSIFVGVYSILCLRSAERIICSACSALHPLRSRLPSFRDLGGMTCKWCSRVNFNLPSTYAAGLGSAVGCEVSVYKSSTVVNNMAPLSSNSRAVAAMAIIIGKITLGTFRAVLRDDASQLVVCAWCTVGRETLCMLRNSCSAS